MQQIFFRFQVLSFLILNLLLFIFSTNTYGQITLNPPAVIFGAPGDTIIVPLNLTNTEADSIRTFVVHLLFSEELLTYIDCEKTGTLTENWVASACAEIDMNVAPGRINIGGFNPNPITTSGVLTNVMFVVNADAIGLGSLQLRNFGDNLSNAATTDGVFQALATAEFVAGLNGNQVVPPVNTQGSGQVTVNLNGDSLVVSGTFNNLAGNFEAGGAHLHIGAAGQNGSAIVTLVPSIDADMRGGIFEGTDNRFALTSVQIIALLTDNIYLDIHTQAFQDGELRGQVVDEDNLFAIATARSVANGQIVTAEGIVTRARGRFTRIQDNTAGVTIFATSGNLHTAVASGDVRMGDRLRVTGRITEFRFLKEITSIISFEVLSRDNQLPDAQRVTLSELAQNGEAYESELIRIDSLSILSSDTDFEEKTTYVLADDNGASAGVTLRTPGQGDTEISGTTIPSLFNFIGILGQFDFSNSVIGYELQPILAEDIEPVVISAVTDRQTELPNKFFLYGNYPNPFNPTTTIQFDLPAVSTVRVDIYDLQGRIALTIPERLITPGTAREISIDASALTTGLYFYQLKITRNRTINLQTGKMMLLK